jgi:hypothetical protein
MPQVVAGPAVTGTGTIVAQMTRLTTQAPVITGTGTRPDRPVIAPTTRTCSSESGLPLAVPVDGSLRRAQQLESSLFSTGAEAPKAFDARSM